MKLHKWNDVKRGRLSEEQIRRVDARVQIDLLEMTLAQLRKELDLTQEQVAAAAEMTQSEFSKIERRDDHRVSTLRRVLRALGGDIEVTAVLPDRRVKLSI
jgi:transcriptional regulator with XRE-family HTH domain